MRKLTSNLLLISLISIIIIPYAFTTIYAADPSDEFTFQGILKTQSGFLITSTHDITLSLFTVETGGTAIWTEAHNDVSVSDGIFTVTAGSTTSLSTINFTQDLYLQVTVANKDGTNSETLTPRIKITASPFSLAANNIQGVATSVLTGSIDPAASTTVTGVGTLFQSELTVGDRITVTGETRTVTAIASNTSLTVDSAFSNNANDTTPDKLPAEITVRDSSGNTDFVIQDTGNVGIGVTAPATLLHLAAGTSTVAPFRMTDGTLLSTPVDGTLEYESTTDALYFTEAGYREQINKRIASTVAVKSVSTWVAHAATEANTWNGIAWSPELGLFAAVSSTGTDRVMTSPNGINWTARNSSDDTNGTWNDIAWSPEKDLFAAVSNNGSVMKSSDGTTWTVAGTIPQANNWNGIAWSPELGLFAAVSSTGTDRVMTSSDGDVWVARNSSDDTSGTWNSIEWSPELGLFAAVSGNGSVMTSSTGTSWTVAGTIPEANNWLDIAWSPELGLFAAVPDSAANLMTSPDGTTWSTQAATETKVWRSIVWSPELGLFVAVSSDATKRVMTSPNGTAWTGRDAAAANNWRTIAWSPELGMFTSLSFSGTNRVMTNTPPVAFPSVYPILFSSECVNSAGCVTADANGEDLGVPITPTFTGSRTLIVTLYVEINPQTGANSYFITMPALGVGTNCGLGDNTASGINAFNHNDDIASIRLALTVHWVCTGVPSGTLIQITHNTSAFTTVVDGGLLTILVL